ncbi:MAG: GNAT family N-acetyltransferase [Oscillospiraceae bacterium]|nr:GNAT family N-acetyltransferase [Oscillospiraceae bacterium]
MNIRAYTERDLPAMCEIWNTVVEEGNAFPQEEPLTLEGAGAFFAAQSFSAVAEQEGRIVGLYILHPNNVGRCGHLANASYAVARGTRGLGVGEHLVRHCLQKGRDLGFRVLQFNAVVSSNSAALHLYEKLGFVRLGKVPGGFRMKDGSFEDIILFYHTL